ncbi:MAG: hypothetical protein IPK26_02090 [Planctomycetes bacterium]|nr:hypothetical protein [Planctomycetota bacterium]
MAHDDGRSPFAARLDPASTAMVGSPAPAGTGEPTSIRELFVRLERIPGEVSAMAQRHRAELAGVPRDSAAYRDVSSRINGEILELQVQAHALQFRAELVSKFVEHTTSGIKTTMQTQA